MGIFDGKVALVTGASSGIGLATAREFAANGASVVLAARREAEGAAAAEGIESEGGQAIFVRTDVSEEDQVEKMVSEATNAFGRLDFAFNNAGVLGDDSVFVDGSAENFNTVMNINVTGMFLCMKYELREMVKAGQGVIINNSSILGQRGGTRRPAYYASKHAVLGMTKVGAKAHGGDGIRVNAVLPGLIETDMIAFMTEDSERRTTMEADVPQGRLGAPEEVAKVVVWLCSDGAGYVNGEGIRIDGGLLSI
ncbi:MAG: glucose 1-dehydrogenase [Chloroflexi bacterium]|nr:glucose 1-dehydrogenase [Chloroflexota bacterium]